VVQARAEAALRENEKRLEAELRERIMLEKAGLRQRKLLELVFTRLPAAIYLVRGADLSLKMANPAYRSLSQGRVRLGETVTDMWPETGERLARICREVLQSGEPYQAADEPFQIRRTEDGPLEVAYFTWSVTRVDLPDEADSGLLITASETTRLLQAEKLARSSADYYRSLVRSMDEAFCVIQILFDRDHRPLDLLFLEANPAFDAQTGLTGPVGRTARQLVPNFEQSWIDFFGQVAESGQPGRIEEPSATMGRWFSAYAFRLGEAEEHKVGVVFSDITLRKTLEAAQEAYTFKLKQSNQALQELAGMASHNLRSPLQQIKALYPALEAQPAGEPAWPPQQPGVVNALQQMEDTLDDLFHYSQTLRGESQLQPVDLGQAARAALARLEGAILRSQAQVELEELHQVHADPEQMGQLFFHLLDNALKFQPPGQAPRVRISSRQVGEDCVELRVEDNGLGFEMEDLDLIFRPFHRLDNSQDRPGSGLGLAICQKIVERHSGWITASSRRGGGSAFVVVLPLDPSR
jgi:signal transduction histidine kinase